MNKYVFMRGYLYNNLNKKQDFINELIENDKALLFLDNEGNFEHTKNIFNYDVEFIQNFIEKANQLFCGEENYLFNQEQSTLILLYPLTVYYTKKNYVDLQIYLRVFNNNSIIITIEADTKLNVEDLFFKKMLYVQSANNYYNEILSNTSCLNILDIFNFILKVISKYLSFSQAISRNFFIIDRESISKKEINRALYQTNEDFKVYKKLKDFRNLKDYYHYSNELASVVYGTNLISAYLRLLMLDHFIIYLILNDYRIYNNIKYNNYKLKELYRIKEENEFSYITQKYALLVEDKDYILYVLKTQNKFNLNNICGLAIDRKITERNSKFHVFISILGLILACIPLLDFIFRVLSN